MNAQECRTLTATCTHIAWLTLCMFNIRSIVLLNPTPELGTGILLTTHPAPKQGSDTRVSDLRVGGRHLAMSLYKLKASVTCFN